MICLITALASLSRSAIFALSPSARAPIELATKANPHATTDIRLIFIVLRLSSSKFEIFGSRQTAYFQHDMRWMNRKWSCIGSTLSPATKKWGL
jgi:hypothetical protein